MIVAAQPVAYERIHGVGNLLVATSTNKDLLVDCAGVLVRGRKMRHSTADAIDTSS